MGGSEQAESRQVCNPSSAHDDDDDDDDGGGLLSKGDLWFNAIKLNLLLMNKVCMWQKSWR
jgi:hypothetical protein